MRASPHSRLPRCSICGSACYFSYLKEFRVVYCGYALPPVYTCSPACESLLRLRSAASADTVLSESSRHRKQY